MTKQEMQKVVQNIIANPLAWVDAGLGHNTVKAAEEFSRERAVQVVESLHEVRPSEEESDGWKNGETKLAWVYVSNNPHLFKRVESLTDPEAVKKEFVGTYGFASGSDFARDVLNLAVARVDWREIVEELRRRKGGVLT